MPKGKGYNARDRAENELKKAKKTKDRWEDGRGHKAPGSDKQSIAGGVAQAIGRAVTGSEEKYKAAKEKEAKTPRRATAQQTTKDISKISKGQVTPGNWTTIDNTGKDKKTYRISKD